MAPALKKVDKIRQIVRLKQMLKKWQTMSLNPKRSAATRSESDSSEFSGEKCRIPAGYLAVYVGLERQRFVIPAKYINLPVFRPILQRAAEEYGFHFNGGLVFPCEVGFFKQLLLILEKSERKIENLSLDEALNLCNEMGSDVLCKTNRTGPEFCPLLQKARV
ncbi:hypothetical protein AMTRI_Chr01g113950 [Amborella trichopoda]|uniref:Uncharacterized protein n=1 Tax=Amborella trichopoda TaxID=13333 RepID=W1PX58_AMBTC|nr:auxin-responsive protein SAUR50 [Amborella trichopoda]ERN12524.1 hypothetical protein AMTR_s00025p00192620 [Amborella trichopoda]|eukprot:XP_006850943.1 auxin-responsive protein SAUR50 [Amborella trichopoda]